MRLEIPAKVLRSAALFASRERQPLCLRTICGVRVAWDDGGEWEVGSTDAVRLFEAWSASRIAEPAGELVFGASVLGALRHTDASVAVDTDAAEVTVTTSKGDSYRPGCFVIEGEFPDLHRLLGDATETSPGHPGAFDEAYLSDFCQAARWLLGRGGGRSIRLSSPTQGAVPELRPAVIDWPGLEGEGFGAQGLLMPMRTGRRSHGRA